jgi:hypothetical protein
MKRKQIMVLAVSVIVTAFCAWSVWHLALKLRDAQAAEKTRDAARQQLEGIFQLKPFPNEANRNQAEDDRARMKSWVNALGQMLVDSNTAVSLSPPLFMQNLQRVMLDLAALSSAAGSKLAPAGFAFGFDRYCGADSGRMPEPEDVPRLSLQLKMIDRLCHELAGAGVLSLTAIRREEFEAGGTKGVEAVAETGGRGSRGGRRNRAENDESAPKKAVVTPGMQKAVRHHFVIEFNARKNAAFDVLNRFSAMDLFVVVTDVAIRKTADDLKVAPAVSMDVDEKNKALTALPDSIQRVVAGPLIDPPLSVRIELDVYVFEGV